MLYSPIHGLIRHYNEARKGLVAQAWDEAYIQVANKYDALSHLP